MFFRISSGCRAGASPAKRAHGNRSGCPTNSTRPRTVLADERRSVSEKARLQDQFRERKCAGWSGIEKQWRSGSRRMNNAHPHLNGKIRVTEFCIISYPIFCFRKNDSAQDFAALHLGGLFFLLCRFGMEGALGLRLTDF